MLEHAERIEALLQRFEGSPSRPADVCGSLPRAAGLDMAAGSRPRRAHAARDGANGLRTATTRCGGP